MTVRINNKKMSDFGLILLFEYNIGTPLAKTKIVDIPGSSGIIDLTENLTGYVPYNNRLLEMEFIYITDKGTDYQIIQSKIMNFCHGQQVKVIFDDDNKFFWTGRAEVSTSKFRGYNSIRIVVDSHPYKYSIISSADQWLWDPFNFLTDVANQLKDLKVVGSLTTTVLGSLIPINPVITSSSQMTVLFENKTHVIKKGTYTYYAISLRSGRNVLEFTGNGVITIDVRGGSL